MKETEEAAVSEGIRGFNLVLSIDEDSNDPRVKLDPGTRQAFSQMRQGLERIFDIHDERLSARVERLELLRTASKDLNVQMAFWDEKGRAQNLDDNGKLIGVERVDKELADALAGIDPADGAQGTLDQSPGAAGWKIPGQAPKTWQDLGYLPFTSVPVAAARAIVTAINDGAGKTKAIGAVTDLGGIGTVTAQAYYADLERSGRIYRDPVTKKLMANPITDDELAEMGGADKEPPRNGILATTETPDRSHATEAEAQAA